jgi:hypothetical protein
LGPAIAFERPAETKNGVWRTTDMQRDLYIYYRVPVAHAAELQKRAAAMQRCLSGDYGIVARLKRRPGEKDGCQTWMEIYEAVPPDFEEMLDRALVREGLAGLIDGQRHTEIFVDVCSCA